MTEALLKEMQGLGTVVYRMGRCWEICEQEISEVEHYDDQPERQSAIFRLLAPSEPLHGKSDTVYRVHVRELIRRSAEGRDTRLATKAEMLCAMLDAATVAPLSSNGAAIADHLFVECFGFLPGEAEATKEQWEGQVDEDLEVMARKLMVADRRSSALR